LGQHDGSVAEQVGGGFGPGKKQQRAKSEEFFVGEAHIVDLGGYQRRHQIVAR
jgi:hypothetical protein